MVTSLPLMDAPSCANLMYGLKELRTPWGALTTTGQALLMSALERSSGEFSAQSLLSVLLGLQWFARSAGFDPGTFEEFQGTGTQAHEHPEPGSSTFLTFGTPELRELLLEAVHDRITSAPFTSSDHGEERLNLTKTRPLHRFTVTEMLRTVARFAHTTHRALSTTADPLRSQILEASLKNVPMLGWTHDAIAKAVLDLGLPPLSHSVIEGPAEVVEYFVERKRDFANEQVALYLAAQDTDAKSGVEAGEEAYGTQTHAHAQGMGQETEQEGAPAALRVGLQAHIDFASPYLPSLPSALAVLADPRQASFALKTALALAEDVCRYGGVSSARGDWYTERGMALVLLGTTELFLLTDSSKESADTKDFLRRNLSTYWMLRTCSTCNGNGASGTSRLTDIAWRFAAENAFMGWGG
ncbi:hypothetical protein B484DRAFT_484167, partial [Ochromonadaceae sp. CCMP2298]